MNKELIYEGKKIFYRSIGKGHPVMFVHGFGEDGNVWVKQIDHLKEHYHLIIPDLAGSGQSEMINDFSMEGMAETLHDILEKENIKTLTIIGHSMGGYILLAFAEKYPGYLKSYGLFHSSSFADSEEKKTNRKKGIEFVKQHGAFEFLKTTTPNLFSELSKNSMQKSIDVFIESLNYFSSEAVIAYYEAMMKRPDRTTILKKESRPVLFIIGEHDIAVPMEDSLKQCHLPTRSFVHILKNSGHMGMMEETEKVNGILTDFLQQVNG